MNLQHTIQLVKDQSEETPYDKFYNLNNLLSIQTVDLIKIISALLNEMIKELQNNSECCLKTAFDGKQRPMISLLDYLNRLSTYSYCSQESILLSIIYIDTLIQKNQFISLTSFNIHRLIATSLVVAIKYFDDQYYENAYYSRLAGISNKELNQLELEFLNLIEYSLFVPPVQFFIYRSKILSFVSSFNSEDSVSKEQKFEQQNG